MSINILRTHIYIYKAEHFCVFSNNHLLHHEINSAHFNRNRYCILLKISVDPIYSGGSKGHQSCWLGKKKPRCSGRCATRKCWFSVPHWYQHWYVDGLRALSTIQANFPLRRYSTTAVYIAPRHRFFQYLGAYPRMRPLLRLPQTFFSALKFIDIHHR